MHPDIDPDLVAAAERGSHEAQKAGNLGEKFKDPLPYVLPTKQQ